MNETSNALHAALVAYIDERIQAEVKRVVGDMPILIRSDRTGVPKQEIQAEIRAGRLRGFKIGSRWYVLREDFRAYAERIEPRPRPPTPMNMTTMLPCAPFWLRLASSLRQGAALAGFLACLPWSVRPRSGGVGAKSRACSCQRAQLPLWVVLLRMLWRG